MPAQKNPLGPTGLTVAENVARLRAQAGYSYVELERRLAAAGRKIPVLGLSHIEQGKRRVDSDDLVALAAALGVNPNALLMPADVHDDEGRATGVGEATVKQLWDWADGWSELPSQHVSVDPALTGQAKGRAMYRQQNGFWNRSRPSGSDVSLYRFLAEVREAATSDVFAGDRITAWSSAGYRIASYPTYIADLSDRDSAVLRTLRADVLAILRSHSVQPILGDILERLENGDPAFVTTDDDESDNGHG